MSDAAITFEPSALLVLFGSVFLDFSFVGASSGTFDTQANLQTILSEKSVLAVLALEIYSTFLRKPDPDDIIGRSDAAYQAAVFDRSDNQGILHQIFQQISGLAPAIKLKRLLQSPFTLHAGVLKRVERETQHAQAGRPARIIAKMNALNEPQVIRALYAASQAGVSIDLIVRGACTLRPGVPGISDNIRVRSIVGRL